MIRIRRNRCRSWADPAAAKALSAEYADRLVEACKGHKGLILALTYRRDEYDDARDLYRRQREERHVRRFIERLAHFLGESLTGRWLCKMEFQRGGWVHWHLVIRDVEYIDQTALTEIWGHGYVWVQRMKPGRLRYICKYIAKGDALPAFILLEPIRSLKIIRVSPGFWPDDGEPAKPPASHTERTETVLAGCYVCIGQQLEAARESSVCQDLDTGRFHRVTRAVHEVVLEIVGAGGRVLGTERGWVVVEGVTGAAVEAGVARGAELASGPAGEARLHLIDTRNPPKRERWRWWDRVILEKIESRIERVAPVGRA